MKTSQQLNNVHNLLLNLLLRECNSWYFLDIVPKYDDYLAFYMQSCPDSTFIRFDLKRENVTLYFPIHYRSLSGMHIFGGIMGMRKEPFGKIHAISHEDTLLLLLQEYFPELLPTDLHANVHSLQDTYNNLVQTQLFNIIPQALAHTENRQDPDKKYIRLKNLINEYSGKEDLDELLQFISKFAQNIKTDVNKATVIWLEHYTECLLNNAVKAYLEQDKIVVPNLLNSILEIDKNGQPAKLIFSENGYVCSKEELPEHFSFNKAEHFLQVQLLTHNLFPIVRAFSILGVNTEEHLLETVAKAITTFWHQYPDRENFVMDHIIYVDFFLPSLFSIQNSEYVRSDIHRHNHLINCEYYSENLIKPKKGGLVHKRYFENSTMEIGIRAFDIETDLEVLYEWVNKDYAKKFWEMDGSIEELEEAYIKHLGVDYSHPYIGTLNGVPIFTLELYWAIKDEVGKYYPFHPGDYGFHMLIAPAKKKINNFSYYALTMCMEHFFSHTQVHRMIGEASVEHAGTHNLITKVGCEFNKALTLPYKTSNLTFLTRAMYKEAVHQVLENSCTEICLKV